MATLAGGFFLLFFVVCAAALILVSVARAALASVIIAWLGSLGSILLMATAVARLAAQQDFSLPLWTLNGWGTLALQVDALSAIFLFITGLVYLSCCVFARDYLLQYFRNRYPVRRYALLHFALMASVALILAAGDVITFLISWECMSVLCFLLVNYEHKRQADKNAAYIMLAMSEAGFLAVAIGYLLAAGAAPNLGFAAVRAAAIHLSGGAAWAIFVLGFLGFGVKSGLVPVNFWLPRCYTATPPLFVPILAGVTLNLGFYGIFRLNGDLVPSPGAGAGVFALVVGSITALVGILYATTENDMKTMLAHSSIENAGIITAGFGAFLVFRSSGHPVPAAIALTASIYHLVNHSVYKALLFQGVSHIEAIERTRDMDRLGGLIRFLPSLSAVFLVACLAISAVPPFNGFVSEWLTLQTLLRSSLLSSALLKTVFALCGAILALTAALAVTCFVKAYAMTFLGIRRASWEPRRLSSNRKWRFSLSVLALACLLLGILPTFVIPVLDTAVAPLAGASATASLVPPFFSATDTNQQLPPDFLHDFHNLGAQTGAGFLPGRGLVMLLRGAESNPVVFAMSPAYAFVALAILLLAAWLIVVRLVRHRSLARREVWAGGIPTLLPEMTYTATGFSNPVRVVFQAIFRPNIVEDTRQTVAVHFRTAILRRREETYLVERIFLHPVGTGAVLIAKLLAGMHHGRLNAYVVYVLGFLVFILLLYRFS